jgi:hypothetical protein
LGNHNIGGVCTPSFFLFFVMLPLGTNGAIAKS